MNFSEQPPSNQWAALKHGGERVAEVWFKPEGEPFSLTFRVALKSFHVAGLGQRLTAENLLKAVGIAAEEVGSWRLEGATPSAPSEPDADLRRPLPPPLDATHLTLHVTLRPPSRHATADEPCQLEVSEGKWQDLEARWNIILGLEARLDTLRISLESLRGELEASARRTLNTEEKVHALNADVAQWNKAKGRVHHALPKVREFVHRATWAAGTPERKQLEELIKTHVRARVPFPEIDDVAEQLECLLKDRQVLCAHGVSVQQECAGIAADIQGALRTLQSSAAANRTKHRAEKRTRGQSF